MISKDILIKTKTGSAFVIRISIRDQDQDPKSFEPRPVDPFEY